MAKSIGKNRNETNEAIMGLGITLNTSTSTKIIDANDDRLYPSISNNGPGKVHIKLQAASIDNDKKGEIVQSGQTWWLPENIYTGEISAIAITGSPVVFPTEY